MPMTISYIDNFLKDNEYNKVIQYCITSLYRFGEVDTPETLPTGMVSEIAKNSEIYTLFESNIKNKVSFIKKMELYRMYINCFSPGENPYFHTDGETGITCLFYVNPSVHIDDGGSTQFIIGKESTNSLPIPNRLCIFDANILHRATSFRNNHRFTIAIKYH